MKNVIIYSQKKPMSREYFSRIYDILEYSFPKPEHRSFDAHFAEFDKPEFRSMVLEDGDILGFMNFWELSSFIYLEHFAVIKELRGKGLGASLMDELKRIAADQPMILEVEPLGTSDIAARRVHFYERLGFVLNPYRYIQPPYNDGEYPLPLSIMSCPRTLLPEEFLTARNELYRTAYELPETSGLFSEDI